MTSNELFERLIATSELSPIFAGSSLTRALRRAGVDPSGLTPALLARALPEIRRALEPFVEQRLEATMSNIERLSRGG